MYPCQPRSGWHFFMHNVPPYISVSPCSQVLDTELDSHCIMLHFLLHKVFSHQIFFDIFHDCNILSILLLPLLIPLLSFNSVMKWRLSSGSITFLWLSSFRLFLCNLNQGHRTGNFYTDLSAVGHSVMRGLVTSGQWFRRKFHCLVSWIKSLD